jgi:hypothetical protein
VILDPPAITTHALASLAVHDLGLGESGDTTASSNHMGDFLFTA